MKTKLINWVKQKLCKHDFSRCEPHNIREIPWLYRWECDKCGKSIFRGYGWMPVHHE